MATLRTEVKTLNPMSGNIVILADDLSGAADCAVACVGVGRDVVVALDGTALPLGVGVLSVDLDTRRMSAAEAGRSVSAFMADRPPHDGVFFKKLDSTLRGHIAVELAAMVQAGSGAKSLGIFAPAYPGLGRTMRGGKCFLHDAPLEKSEIWRHERLQGEADIKQVLNKSGLKTAVVTLEQVRDGRLAALFGELAASYDVIACDSEHDSDLDLIAHAASDLSALPGFPVFWAGSGGLAQALGRLLAMDTSVSPQVEIVSRNAGGLLFVSGSLSTVSRRQVDLLVEHYAVTRIEISASKDAAEFKDKAAKLRTALAQGHDVALSIASGETVSLDKSAQLTETLARLVAPQAALLGGLVVTGGETARAVLKALNVKSLRLIKEITPGVPMAVSHDAQALLVITKAGAFGDETTFLKCHAALSDIPVRQKRGETL